MKRKKFNELLEELAICDKCTNMPCSNKSLINIYNDYNFCTNIPSIWTDWFNRLNSEIMIIGQDWGPYCDMKAIHDDLNENKSNWNEIMENEKSSTKRSLENYIRKSSNNKYSLNEIYVTNAIMCARQGNTYRGNNIDLKKSSMNCKDYLLRQIKIVNPKVILTLGYYPLLSLSKIFDFKIANTLKETILEYPEILSNGYVIIPLYHPVAQVRKTEQLKQYKRIWKYINIDK